MERAILELLAEHDWLGYEQIAEVSGKRPGDVRQALERLRERGLVAVLPVGVLEGNKTRAASYWRLTEEGNAAVREQSREPTLEQRAQEARERAARAKARAQAAHERAAVLHKRAADFQEHHAALERALGHDGKAQAMEQQADQEREREQNEAARANEPNP